MIDAALLSQLRPDIAEGRFEIGWRVAFPAMRQLGLRPDDLARGLCDPASHPLGVANNDDPRLGRHGFVACPTIDPPLTISLWCITDPPRSILIDDVVVSGG